MQNLICLALLGVVATGAFFTKDPAKVKKTMVVKRCQAVLEDGSQCQHQAESETDYCWRHQGAVKAVNETMKDAREGGKRAWASTKSWSSNVWESTKSGWNRTVDATTESLDDVRVGMVELLGGQDAKNGSQKKVERNVPPSGAK